MYINNFNQLMFIMRVGGTINVYTDLYIRNMCVNSYDRWTNSYSIY